MQKVPVTIEMDADVAEFFQHLTQHQRQELQASLEQNARHKMDMDMEEKRTVLKKRVYDAFGADQAMIDWVEAQLTQGTMSELLETIHLEAQANGLTEEIFNELMMDDDLHSLNLFRDVQIVSPAQFLELSALE